MHCIGKACVCLTDVSPWAGSHIRWNKPVAFRRGYLRQFLIAHGVLPGLFAWPAGLGDVAIGIAAAFVLVRLRRDPEFALSLGFLRFHVLGLLDFAVAIATAGLSAGQFPGSIENGVTSAAMDVWPLNIFPSFFVPVFIILHLTTLFKIRQMRRERPVIMRATAVTA